MPRRSKCTKKLVAEVVAKVERGVPADSAAQIAGIGLSTYYEWMEKGGRGIEPYAGFRKAAARARAVAEASLLERVRGGDEKGESFGQAKAALEILSRGWPKRWSTQVRMQLADELGRFLDVAKRVCSPEDYCRILEELASEDGGATAAGDPGDHVVATH